MEASRRTFLKTGVVVGGLAWVAPVIVSATPAFAASTPPPACTCNATGSAFGIQVSAAGVLNVGPLPAPPGNASLTCVPISVIGVGTACNQVTNCFALGEVTNLNTSLLPVLIKGDLIEGLIQLSGSNCCNPTVTSNLTNVTVAGIAIPVGASPNTTLSLVGGTVTVVINEQPAVTCSGTQRTFVVNALHVTVTLAIVGTVLADVVIGHASLTTQAGCC